MVRHVPAYKLGMSEKEAPYSKEKVPACFHAVLETLGIPNILYVFLGFDLYSMQKYNFSWFCEAFCMWEGAKMASSSEANCKSSSRVRFKTHFRIWSIRHVHVIFVSIEFFWMVELPELLTFSIFKAVKSSKYQKMNLRSWKKNVRCACLLLHSFLKIQRDVNCSPFSLVLGLNHLTSIFGTGSIHPIPMLILNLLLIRYHKNKCAEGTPD